MVIVYGSLRICRCPEKSPTAKKKRLFITMCLQHRNGDGVSKK